MQQNVCICHATCDACQHICDSCLRLAKRLPFHTSCLPVQKCGHNDYVTPQLITHIVIVTTITVSATVTITVATIIVIVSWLKMFDPTALAAVSFRCIRTSSHQLNTLEACRWLFFFFGPRGDRGALCRHGGGACSQFCQAAVTQRCRLHNSIAKSRSGSPHICRR